MENILNEYGSAGIRVTKVEKIEDRKTPNKNQKFVLYLEEKIKK